jgi:hypothetical protein
VSIRVTGIATQARIYHAGSINNRRLVAHTTESLTIQRNIAESKNITILRALATNPHLFSEIENKLVNMKDSRINSLLINRRVKG